jgi:ribonuclease P protein component
MPVWRIRDRRTFEDLRVRGRRHRAGFVAVTAIVVDDGRPPRVAYAIGKAVGPAVVRNAVRRRLRAAAAELALPSGAYLVSAAPGARDATYGELKRDLEQAVSAAEAAAR